MFVIVFGLFFAALYRADTQGAGEPNQVAVAVAGNKPAFRLAAGSYKHGDPSPFKICPA